VTINSDAHLRLSAQRALFGAAGPNLVRFTGEVRDNVIFLQWLVFNEANEDEIEDYRVVGTEIVADHVDEHVDEQFLKIDRLEDAKAIPPLANQFFCRNLNGAPE
jgi:hypothetical protein